MRKDSGRVNAVFVGLRYLQVLALLRSPDPTLKKKAQHLLELALRQPGADASVVGRLNDLWQVPAGERQASDDRNLTATQGPLATLLAFLVQDWLGQPMIEAHWPMLEHLCLNSERAGFTFMAAQAAQLLGRTHINTRASYTAKAVTLRSQQGMVDLTDWFARQEPWQRQLAALVGLAPASAADGVLVLTETPTRLRVIQVSDEHQRIAAILGQSLRVPVRAKEQVINAIRSISSLITIVSDLDELLSEFE